MIDPQLPLVDIHRHLDGNIRPETIWDLATRHNIALPAKDLDELRPLCQIQDKTADLLAFLSRLDYGISVLADTDACYRIAYENMQDAKRAGLDYVELRFSPFYMAQSHQLNVADVVEATIAGCTDGSRDFAIKHNLIGILSRTFGTDACTLELNGLLAHKDPIRLAPSSSMAFQMLCGPSASPACTVICQPASRACLKCSVNKGAG